MRIVKNATKKAAPAQMQEPLNVLEATSGIEPLNNGFADHCLTAWLRRRCDDRKY